MCGGSSPEVASPEMTSPEVMNRNWKWKGDHFPHFLPRISRVFYFFSYYSSSTKCTIAHDRHGYRMWRQSRDRKGGFLGRECACATGSWAISALLGSFHRKWRNQTSPVGLPLDFSDISPWDVILFVLNFQRTSPFTGYLSLSRNFIFIGRAFNNYISYKSLLFSDMFEVVL